MIRPIMRISDPKMQAWARAGALIRLRELEAERVVILRAFPELGKRQASSDLARNLQTPQKDGAPDTI